MSLKSVGSIVMPLASGQNVSQELAGVIENCIISADQEAMIFGFENNLVRIESARTRLLACLSLCESPIEKLVLAALAFTVIPDTLCFPPAIHDFMSGEPWPNSPFVIVPQFVVARYRLDFLVSIEDQQGTRTLVAIECDGANFHNGIDTRQRDANRDSYLAKLGIRTVRISGQRISKLREKLSNEFAAMFAEKRVEA